RPGETHGPGTEAGTGSGRPGTGDRHRIRTPAGRDPGRGPGPAQRTLSPSPTPSPALRTAIDPYGVRRRSQAPEARRAAGAVPRRKPSDWAACTARTGRPMSPKIGRAHV